jgi:hypothetical protein
MAPSEQNMESQDFYPSLIRASVAIIIIFDL